MEFLFGMMKNLLELIVVVVGQFCEYTTNHWIVHFKGWVTWYVGYSSTKLLTFLKWLVDKERESSWDDGQWSPLGFGGPGQPFCLLEVGHLGLWSNKTPRVRGVQVLGLDKVSSAASWWPMWKDCLPLGTAAGQVLALYRFGELLLAAS